jgi:hypothetical protein
MHTTDDALRRLALSQPRQGEEAVRYNAPCGGATLTAPAVVHGPELTDRENRVLQYIIDFTEEHFFQPSVREICMALEISSTKTVAEVVQSLTRKGYIAEDGPQRGARSLRLVGIEVSITRTLLPPGPATAVTTTPTEPAGAAV